MVKNLRFSKFIEILAGFFYSWHYLAGFIFSVFVCYIFCRKDIQSTHPTIQKKCRLLFGADSQLKIVIFLLRFWITSDII